MFIEETLELNSTNMNRNIIDGLENILEPRYLCQSHEIHVFKCLTYSNQLCLCLSNWHMNGPNLDNYHMTTVKRICIVCKGLTSHLVRQVILGITRTASQHYPCRRGEGRSLRPFPWKLNGRNCGCHANGPIGGLDQMTSLECQE